MFVVQVHWWYGKGGIGKGGGTNKYYPTKGKSKSGGTMSQKSSSLRKGKNGMMMMMIMSGKYPNYKNDKNGSDKYSKGRKSKSSGMMSWRQYSLGKGKNTGTISGKLSWQG